MNGVNTVIYSLHGETAFLLGEMQALVVLKTTMKFLADECHYEYNRWFFSWCTCSLSLWTGSQSGVLVATVDSALACVWALLSWLSISAMEHVYDFSDESALVPWNIFITALCESVPWNKIKIFCVRLCHDTCVSPFGWCHLILLMLYDKLLCKFGFPALERLEIEFLKKLAYWLAPHSPEFVF